MPKFIKKLISGTITIALLVLVIWWTFSFKIESKSGNVLPHGSSGQVFIIKDNNPLLNFKITYNGPEFSREININNGDYAIVLFNQERRELYIYSDPQQMTLRVSANKTDKDFSFDNFGIWKLMFSNKAFFKHGDHQLTLSVR